MKKSNLMPIKKTRVKSLTYGYRKMVYILTAVIAEPEILFLDDPFDNLSRVDIKTLINIFKFLSKEKGTTIIFSTGSLHNGDLHNYDKFIYLDNSSTIFVGTSKELDDKLEKIGFNVPKDINGIEFLEKIVQKYSNYNEIGNQDSITERLKALYEDETKYIKADENKVIETKIIKSYTPSFFHIKALLKRRFHVVYSNTKKSIIKKLLFVVGLALIKGILIALSTFAKDKNVLDTFGRAFFTITRNDPSGVYKPIFDDRKNFSCFLDVVYTFFLFDIYNFKIFYELHETIKSEREINITDMREQKYNIISYSIYLLIYTTLSYLIDVGLTMPLHNLSSFYTYPWNLVFIHVFDIAPLFLLMSFGFILFFYRIKYCGFLLMINRCLISLGVFTTLRPLFIIGCDNLIFENFVRTLFPLISPFSFLSFHQFDIVSCSNDIIEMPGSYIVWMFIEKFKYETLIFFDCIRSHRSLYIRILPVLWFLIGLGFIIYKYNPRYKI
ncbi:hypothetical protein EDEG_03080 [Edhazardia aedis USNM 41457]|uniref:ABC transporter domain-containing protein n=1 Tax=Edhazardia aedis (strain USNM 41457) TaxID=1003232 RepID=J9D4P0_EDHAE|nr:hypothetical protein EDEG_03080 [Edhazardia aedis USNM 41457]|eukprot:EJW02514.1 hypothetical protein EDEG_03080 [Edhazardia aedis USNM 41457]